MEKAANNQRLVIMFPPKQCNNDSEVTQPREQRQLCDEGTNGQTDTCVDRKYKQQDIDIDKGE